MVKYLLFGNFFISIGALLWALSTYCIILPPVIKPNENIIFLIFFSTLFIYNISRLFQLKDLKADDFYNERREWFKSHSKILWWITIISFLVSFYFLFKIKIHTLIFFFMGSAVTLLYYYIPSGKKKLRLRDVNFLKIFLIAFVWTWLTFVLPFVDAGIKVNSRYALMACERFLFTFIITVPFDLRDIKFDLQRNLKTISNKIGFKKSIILINAGVVFLILLQFLHFRLDDFLVMIFSGIYISVLSFFLNRSNDELFYLLFWDGAILLQAFLFIFFHKVVLSHIF